ncbi:MAG: sigma-70 family RNA polymerase sigma factor [Chloroflexota bacterium]|nr:MAG: sigma-70 family RNA polymerase sigma factor [Chloroflexota bacterium]
MIGSLVANRLEDSDATRLGGESAAAVTDPRAAAFRRLVGADLDRAYRLAAVILGDRFDAEDAVHDAALAAWSRWRDLRDPDRFEAWFGRILVNACRDRLRRRRRRAVEVIRAPLEAEHPSVTDATTDRALRDLVRRALDGLTEDERVVVVLRFEADMTVPAIADLLGIPEGTVKSRLHHALGRLRASIPEADR